MYGSFLSQGKFLDIVHSKKICMLKVRQTRQNMNKVNLFTHRLSLTRNIEMVKTIGKNLKLPKYFGKSF